MSGTVSPDGGPASDDWKLIQKNVFTRWCNERLKVVQVTVEELQTDLSDGVRLILLVQVLSQKKVGRYNKKPRIHAQKMENVQLALDLLMKKEKIRLVNIGAGDIEGGNLKLILGLIWTLILHYQISIGFGIAAGDDKKGGKQVSAKEVVKDYIQDLVPHKKVTNFTTDWNDGILVAALVDAVAPGLCPEAYTMKPEDGLENAKLAMDRAEDWLGIPQVLLPQDIVNPKVDAHSVMTYISQFPEAKLKDGAPLQVTGDPSKVVVSGPGVAKEIPTNAEVPFFVDTTKAGVGPLNVDITGPDEKRLVPDISYKDGVYTYKYTAPAKGKFAVKVVWCGKPVPGSTFTVSAVPGAKMPVVEAPVSAELSSEVCSAPLIFATGKGLEEGVVEEWAEFEVDLSKAGSGGFDVKIDGPAKAETKITQQPDGKVLVKYMPKVVGRYSIYVKFADIEISGSPFTPTITAKALVDDIPTKTKVFELSQVQEGVKLGEEFQFKLDTSKSAVTRKVTAIIAGPFGKTDIPDQLTTKTYTLKSIPEFLSDAKFDPELVEEGGVYTVKFVPDKIGVYALLLFFGDTPVQGTPHFFGVNDPSAVKLTGSGCGESEEVFHIEKPLAWKADCTKAGPGTLKAFIFGPEECNKDVKVEALPDSEDIYSVDYTPDVAGSYKLAVTFGGHEIENCPTLHVSDPSKASIAGIKYAYVGDEVPFKIDLSAAGSGKLSAQLKGPSQEPLSFKDNKDGTGTLSFVATQIGHYELEAKFGEKQISDVPLEVAVIDPAALSIYGSGFTGKGAVIGKPALVFIDTSKAGPGSLEVKVTPPDGEEETLEVAPLDDNPEIFKCHYVPKKTGEYKLEIIFACKPDHCKGSPFTVPITNPTAVKLSVVGFLFVIPGETCALDCFTESAGPGMLTVDFEGDPIDVQVKPIAKDHQQLVFAAPDEDSVKATVCYNGVPVASPICISTGDASKCKVSGPGISAQLPVDKETSFTVDTTEAGKGKLKTNIVGPNGKPVPVKVDKVNENQYVVCYTPEEVGNYDISVHFADQNLPDSPYETTAYNPAAVSCTLDTPSIATLGEPAEIKVDVSKAGLGEEPLEVSVEGPVECPLFCNQIEDDILTYSFKPEEPGTYKVPISYAGCPISKEPLEVTFIDPLAVEVSGPGVTGEDIKLNQPAEVVIDTSKSGSAPVEAKLTKPSGEVDTIQLQPKDEEHPEVLVASYTPEESGPYAVDVSFNDQPVTDSPFEVYVPKNEEIALCGPGLSKAVAGEPNILDFFMKNMEPEATQVKFATPEGEEIPVECMIVPIDEDHCQVQYVPQDEMTMFALPLYAEEPIGEKFPVAVGCPEKCKASGPGLESKLPAGEETWFEVDTTEAGPGSLKVSIATPGDVPVKVHTTEEKPGVEKVTYTPRAGGEYEVTVTYNDVDVPGSPFPVSVVNPKAVTQDLISPIRIALGEPVELEVDTSDAGEGDLKYAVEGPAECLIEANDHRDGTQTLSFTPTAIGTYKVPISYADLPVSEKPLEVTVTNPSAVEVSGPGVTGDGIKLNQPAEVVVDTSKSGIAPVEAKVTKPSGDVDTLKFQPKDEQHPEVMVASYTPEESGNYVLDISFDDQLLEDSPYAVYVPKDEDVSLSGPGLSEAVVGEPNIIDFFKNDVNPEEVEMKFASPKAKSVVPLKCEVKEIDKDHCQIVYVPEEEGALLALPIYAGQPIGYDLAIAVANPSKCTVSGPGVESKLLAGKRTHFTIDATQAGPGSPKVTITTPSGFKLRRKIRKTKRGMYVVKYTPRMVGQHQVAVKYNKRPVNGSPFAVSVFNPNAVTSKVIGPRLVPVGQNIDLAVDVTRAGEGELNVSVCGPEECSIDAKPTGKDDNIIFSIAPTSTGLYELPVTFDNLPTARKPVSVIMTDISKVVASGSGVTGKGAQLGSRADVVVDTTEAGPAPVSVLLTRPSKKRKRLRMKPKRDEPEVLVGRYTPRQSGHYLVAIRFGNEPLPQSPYRVFIASAGDIKITGPGASVAAVGEENVIDFFKEGVDEADIDIEITTADEESRPVHYTLEKVDDDHCRIKYSPDVEAPLAANISYAGSPVRKLAISSIQPSKCVVTKPDEPLVVGLEACYTIDTNGAGKGTISSVAVMANDSQVDTVVEKTETAGIYKAVFTPTYPGKATVTIMYSGVKIGESPFEVDVVNLPSIVVTGLDGEPTLVGDKLEFQVDTSAAKPGKVEAVVTAPSEKQVPVEVNNVDENQYAVSFTPEEAGDHTVSVLYEGHNLPDSPYEATAYNPAAVSCTLDTPSTATLGEPAEIKVDVSKAGLGEEPLDVSVEGPVECPLFCNQTEDDILTYSFKPEEPGTYKVPISYAGCPISKEPLEVTFVDPLAVEVSGPGVTGDDIKLNQPAEVVIDTSKSGSAPVEAKLTKPSGEVDTIQLQPKDEEHPEVLVASYTPEESGPYAVDVSFNDQPLTDSPFEVYVPNNDEIALCGPGLSKAVAGEPNVLDFFKKNIEPEATQVKFASPEGEEIPVECSIVPIDEDHCQVQYVPPEEMTMFALPLYAEEPIGEKFPVAVGCPEKCKASGPGLESKLPAGEETWFEVDTTEAGPGSLNVSVATPGDVPVKVQTTEEKPGVEKVKYTPRAGGEYEVSVTYNDIDIPGSPFPISVVNPKAVTQDLISPQRISLGEPVELEVDTRDAGEGDLDYSVEGPEECPIEASNHEDGTQTLSFTPTAVGTYKVPISYADLPVSEKPLEVTVTNPSAVEVSGPGVIGDGIKPHKPAEVVVDTSKSGIAPVEAKLTKPSGDVDTLKFQPKDEQHPEVMVASYTPEESGNYVLDISFDDQPLEDSPYAVYVPKDEDVSLSGPGLSEAVVGEPNIIDFFKNDVKPEEVEMKFASPKAKSVVPFDCEVKEIDKDHCQIVYVPEEEGALLALPLYAGKPIGHDLAIAVANPSKCTVSGPGVESKLLAGKRTHFTIDATQAGPGSPKVTITTPSGFKLRRKIRKTKKGMYVVKYTPRMVGQHQVAVKYNKRPVNGSPFAVSVFNPNAVTSKVIGPRLVPVGQNIDLAVDVTRAGEGELNVSVCGPEECSIDAKPTGKDDNIIFSVAPTSTGLYELPVTFDNLPTAKKPVSVIMTDISKVVASGSGVTGKGAQLGSRADVVVDTTEAGPAPVSVLLTRPSKKRKRLRMKPKRDEPEVLVGRYTPRQSGLYLVAVRFGNEPLPQSPYRVYIASAGDIKITGPGASVAAVGEENVIDFFKEGVDEADIGVELVTADEEKRPVPCTLEKVDDDHCQIKYTPDVEAPLAADICYAGNPIKKLAISPVQPSKCVVTAPDGPFAIGGKACYTIDTNGAGKGTVSGVAVMANDSKVDAVVEETSTAGIYKAVFTPTCSGQASVTILFSGIKIGKSPYLVEVLDLSSIVVSGLDGEPTLVGDKLEFQVDTTAVAVEGELKAFIEEEDEEAVSLTQEGDGKYNGCFSTLSPGEYHLHIVYSGADVPGSPFICPFQRPPPDASKVILENTDKRGEFTIDARYGGGNGVLEVAVYGAYVPAHHIAVKHNGDYTFSATYDLPKRMKTTISVKWHGVHVCNSPFTVTYDD